MTVMDILGIIAENLSPQIPMLCGYVPLREKIVMICLKNGISSLDSAKKILVFKVKLTTLTNLKDVVRS